MLVSYCPRDRVVVIGLRGYVQYDVHMELPILVRRIENVPSPYGGHSQE